ncbi:hypothetical protein EI94DRAFT_1761486 [Lactarius quietus]|nr:hypothetical protein EI94DRAFT_1761486 [Lactarius quietus]
MVAGIAQGMLLCTTSSSVRPKVPQVSTRDCRQRHHATSMASDTTCATARYDADACARTVTAVTQQHDNAGAHPGFCAMRATCCSCCSRPRMARVEAVGRET